MSDCTCRAGVLYRRRARRAHHLRQHVPISAVVVRSLTTQARSQKVPSANYVRQLQSFHYDIARLATGSFLVCVAGCENIASRCGPTRRRPAFEIGLVQSPDDHTHASPNNMRTLNFASQRTCVDEVGQGHAQRSPISKCLGTVATRKSAAEASGRFS